MLTFEEVEKAKFFRTIVFPLIVPSWEEILSSKELDLSKSALNACYSKQERNQSWYDVQFTVEGQANLPSKSEWFYIFTDDKCFFKAYFSGSKVKRLSTFENEKIIGKWIKGRFVEWELVNGYEYVSEDEKKRGIITKEMMESYGGDKLLLQKTNKTMKDEKGIERGVWYLSFPSKIISKLAEVYPWIGINNL